MTFKQEAVRSAVRHLRAKDQVLRGIIDEVGPFTLRTQRGRFNMLVRSIISQQISTSAARTIRQRVADVLAPEKITATALLGCDAGQLRAAGLSKQKASYILDLARRVDAGQVRLTRLAHLSDSQIIGQLTQVKGIGEWTAQMFLIFALGRPDVFPHSDLGIRQAIRRRYGFEDLPGKTECLEIAEPWRPYSTIASWYCWRSLET